MMPERLSPGFPLRLLFCAAVLFSASCSGGNGKAVYPVKGKVLFQNRPAAGAVVFFHPQNPSEKDAVRPQGTVGPDGTFELTTYSQNDGAPAGRYLVTVIWGEPGSRGDDFQRELLPRRYGSPSTSKLTAEVRDRPTELPPFQLTK
jgi:hypothetical protein